MTELTPEVALDDTLAPAPVDGRRARGERNRDAVVVAILELLREGVDRPGAAEIAERSGVSVRSVFRHFDDLESLYAAAVERQYEHLRPLFASPPKTGPVGARIHALAVARARLFEEITPVRPVAERLRRRSPVIDRSLELGRVELRRQLDDVLGPALDAVPDLHDPARSGCLDALEAVSSWPTWHQLRGEQGCAVPRATEVVEQLLRAVLVQAGVEVT